MQRRLSQLTRSEDDVGWFNTGLRPFRPWLTTNYTGYWRERIAADADVPFDTASQNQYRTFMSKTVCTPGTVAGRELFLRSTVLRYRPYLTQYAAEWATRTETDDEPTTPFEDSLMQAAVVSTKFMVTLIERWQRWCDLSDRPKTRETFREFSGRMPRDMDLTGLMLERMHFFSISFSCIYSPPSHFPLVQDVLDPFDVALEMSLDDDLLGGLSDMD